MKRERRDTGEYKSQLNSEEVLEAVYSTSSPVSTSKQIAEKMGCSQQAAREHLDELVREGKLMKMEVGARANVWYPLDWRKNHQESDEVVILFPERREVVIQNPTDTTRSQLSQFAHLVDSISDAVMYKLRNTDIWQAPHDSLNQLLADFQDIIDDPSPHLEDWITRQWDRAHQFTLKTHEDGFTVLEAKEEEKMEEIARRELSGKTHLYRHLSATESRVVNGKEAEVKEILYEAGYPVQDYRTLKQGNSLDIDHQLDLRDYQELWRKRFMDRGAGVLVGPSGSGKTVAAIGVMEAVGGETLILVPSRELATQWRSELIDQTSLSEDSIGEYHGGEKEISPVTIATYHTAGMSRHKDLFDERHWGLIIMDEAHHIPAPIFRRAANLQAQHRLGLTATPVRESDDEKEIFTLIGPPIGTDWQGLFGDEYVQDPAAEIRYVPWDSERYMKQYQDANGHKQLQIAGMNPHKLEEIKSLREKHSDEKVLIFVEWLDQGQGYEEKLEYPFISGDTPHERRDELFEEYRQGKRDTLIISRVGDEGIDLPDAEVAIVASGLGGSRRQGAQRAGRTMRPVGNSKIYILATRGSKEEDFAKRQMQHLVEKGIQVSESGV